MSYVVPAASQLLDEIADIGGKAEVLDDVDGLGWHRSIRMTKATAEKLGGDVLEALADDQRVAEMVGSAKGVRVTFVESSLADHRTPFGLASVV